ncbi:unnamed protein product [Rotaria sp. Silwood2]|nr:unnamed protein product [Rotaria sp. Silwood2]CAF4229436.1 unnamed protein product [Rotaria sp. Silwood2]
MDIGNIRFKQRKYDQAIDCYQQSVALLNEYHSDDHIKIAEGLEWIAFILNQSEENDDSAKYLEPRLRVREASLSPENLTIVKTLSVFSVVQESRHEYELSLAYELKCFLIRKKILPPDHQDIGISLCNIGRNYEHVNQPKLVLNYYKQALVVYEQCLPASDEDRLELESDIQRLSEGSHE